MKKLFAVLLAMFLMISVVNAEEKAKVKVYMFEAGGCPYCEAEEEYLKKLSGYGKTFELIKKELYVDHVEWKQGKDYALGKKVAEAFNEAGFEDASYEGTPFVVISDLYAAATYSTDLETLINAAYEEGDKDAVTCIQKGGKSEDCIRANVLPTEEEKTSKASDSKAGIVIAIVGGVLLIGVIAYVFKNHNNEAVDEVEEAEEETTEEVEEVVEKPVRKVAKKTTVKKPVKKTTRK